MAPFKLAIVVGSNRRESINRKLAQALTGLGRDSFSASIVQIDDLPLYNQDLESDLPKAVARFKSEIEAADAVLFVTPEHNRSIPAVLKNAIDWGTRPWGKNSWAGKVAAITGASIGTVGTALAQQHLRQILGVLGVVVAGGEAYLTFKPGLIDDNAVVTDEGDRSFLKGFVDQFAVLVARFAEPTRAAA